MSIYHIYHTSHGLEVWVGKNHTANDILTFEQSKWNDLWFHVKGFGGAHVLLKYKEDQPFTQEDIVEAAKIAVNHSGNKNAKVVTYTECINIEKPKRSRKGTVVIMGDSKEVYL